MVFSKPSSRRVRNRGHRVVPVEILFETDIPVEMAGSNPPGTSRVFFEETSLVARPGVSFEECRERAAARLKFHNVSVVELREEELCAVSAS